MPSQPGESRSGHDDHPDSAVTGQSHQELLRFSTGELIAALAQLAAVVPHEKPWGREQELSVPGLDFTVKHLVVNPYGRTSLQVHERKDEIIIIVGCGLPLVMELGFIETAAMGGELQRCAADRSVVHIPPGVIHRVTGPLEYLEISTHHPADVTRFADDYGRS